MTFDSLVWVLPALSTYLSENLLCLFYGIDLLATKYAFFASYHDLLTDIAEAFGVWVALTVLVLSGLVLLVSIQSIASNSLARLASSNSTTNVLAGTTAYKYWSKFIKNSRNGL